ncbi:MAG: hypothetical protein EOM23_12090, partial [Candidatus Moranbacteria bacterium]|nr:hypothetical protein [Candidatus Moranbacteria bacterium]
MADDNYNTLDKLKLRKLKSFLLSKDALSFLLFLLLSGLFWFVNALDKNREITIRVPLQIKNLSEQIAVTTDLPDFITVDISDIGINLFSYSNKKLKPLTISMSNYQFSQKGEIQLDAASINRFLQSYFLPSTRILAFSPDSIKIEYEKLAAKKVPVKL